MALIDDIIEREGGLVDHPNDPGGITNFGITIPAMSDWLGRAATPDDIRALTRPRAHAFYEWFFKRHGLDKIVDEKLRAAVFDGVVNHGPDGGIRCLQRAVGATVDGVLGPETVRKATGPSNLLVFRFLRQRRKLYTRLAQKDARQLAFLDGWLNRIEDQIEPLLA